MIIDFEKMPNIELIETLFNKDANELYIPFIKMFELLNINLKESQKVVFKNFSIVFQYNIFYKNWDLSTCGAYDYKMGYSGKPHYKKIDMLVYETMLKFIEFLSK